MIDQHLITTSIELNGYRITKNLGVVRGITVRSRSLFGNMAGGFSHFLAAPFPFMLICARKPGKKLFS